MFSVHLVTETPIITLLQGFARVSPMFFETPTRKEAESSLQLESYSLGFLDLGFNLGFMV